MARIRTIKPEFWTSPQIVGCSTNARLLFIGLWNFADDGGVTPFNSLQIKMRVFPGDAFSVSDIEDWIQELTDAGLLCAFENNSLHYLAVTGWTKHQKIDRPSYRHPQPSDEGSTIIRGTFDECSSSATPRKGMEGNGREGNGETPLPKPEVPACPHREIISLYHETLPELPRIMPNRWAESEDAKHLRTRWRSDPAHQNLDWWRQFFLAVRTNSHWMGENNRGWKANLRWLVNKTNFTKVVEHWANAA